MSIYRAADWPYFNRIRKCMEESKKDILIWRGQEEVLYYQSRGKCVILKKM
jgi:hypothetical protein